MNIKEWGRVLVALLLVAGVGVGLIAWIPDMVNNSGRQPAVAELDWSKTDIVVDASGSMATCAYIERFVDRDCITAADVARVIARAIYDKVKQPDLWVFSGAGSNYPADIQRVTPEELADVKPEGGTSFEVALSIISFIWRNGKAFVLITDADGSSPSLEQFIAFKKDGTKLILVVINPLLNPSSHRYDAGLRPYEFESLEYFSKETGGAVIFVDPLNVQEAINKIIANLPKESVKQSK